MQGLFEDRDIVSFISNAIKLLLLLIL